MVQKSSLCTYFLLLTRERFDFELLQVAYSIMHRRTTLVLCIALNSFPVPLVY